MTARLPVRFVEVVDVHRLTPHMVRITFGGEDLATSIAEIPTTEPDQQMKLYFPRAGQRRPRMPEPDTEGDFMRWYAAYGAIPEPERPWMRSFTIRRVRPGEGLVDVDFVLHDDAGPAARWAQSARPGDTLGMFGPSATFARSTPLSASVAAADWLLLAGDETALPAIGTLVEWLPSGTRALAYLEVRDAAEEQRFETRGDLTLHWSHRGDVSPGHGTLLLDAVRGAEFPPGSVFAWIAGESAAVRSLRRHLVDERGVAKQAIDFSGYWRLRLSQDDAPTTEDLAEAQERLALAASDPST
ncbi:siderophore-interacting protein [Actinopolymorpha pittospori]|uniref:NADPH-dependent ferric siderophore reductase n=1 Tax=Actinopolymorpha pittospori TaxID=648752 RepID=A0A927RC07_9ACTN|nr:siderophore-interacting protein [Actinopolymorpha pittospori]MBE1606630.1 NADPH-dependent ferric siderophore reductase [Actinopolymorpha pittospori]